MRFPFSRIAQESLVIMRTLQDEHTDALVSLLQQNLPKGQPSPVRSGICIPRQPE